MLLGRLIPGLETLKGLVWGRESLFGYALLSHFRRRREWPAQLAGRPVVRLTTPAEVARWRDGQELGLIRAPEGQRREA